jgi:hypothetical protein
MIKIALNQKKNSHELTFYYEKEKFPELSQLQIGVNFLFLFCLGFCKDSKSWFNHDLIIPFVIDYLIILILIIKYFYF